MIFEKEALGTILRIEIFDTAIDKNRVELCFDTIFQFEQKYSRFIKGNYLYNLNTTGQAYIDEELKMIIKATKNAHSMTNGEFDITLLPCLENMGYGISKDVLPEKIGMQHIIIDGDMITLANQVKIDLGGVGKGYLIDKLYALLEKQCEEFVINFGGDIKVKGKKTLGLEDPYDSSKIIGEIPLQNASLCASSGEKRKLKNGSHHLISGKTLKSQSETLAVYTSHPFAILADIYATALFVCPLQQSLKVLEKVNGLEALIISRNGNIYKSSGFHSILY